MGLQPWPKKAEPCRDVDGPPSSHARGSVAVLLKSPAGYWQCEWS